MNERWACDGPAGEGDSSRCYSSGQILTQPRDMVSAGGLTGRVGDRSGLWGNCEGCSHAELVVAGDVAYEHVVAWREALGREVARFAWFEVGAGVGDAVGLGDLVGAGSNRHGG